MGLGAIILLMVLATWAGTRANRFIAEGDEAVAAWIGVLFVIDVVIYMVGNPWIWAGWAALGVVKMIFFPSQDLIAAAEKMPPEVHQLNIVFSAAWSGALYALFQWLR